MKLTLRTAFCLALLLAMTGHVGAEPAQLQLPAIGDPASRALSMSQERELGREMMREVRQRLPLVEDAEISAYIADLGLRLASHSDAAEFEFQFFVVDLPSINAFAMPGGYIGINSGLILAARTESELAAVIAHEIAHVTQRHIARRIARAQQSNLRTAAIILAAIIVGSQDPQAGSAAAMAAMAGGIQQQLDYSREHEYEADRIGVRALAAAGLDPQGMPAFFGRLLSASHQRNQMPEWLSSHPLTEARVADSQARAQSLNSDKPIFESPDFDFMRAKLRLHKMRSLDAAEEYFANAYERDRKASDGYGLALTQIGQGEFEPARELLESILDTTGQHAPLLTALADLELKAGHRSRAFEIYDDALSLYGDNRAIRQQYAEALLASDAPERARRLLSQNMRPRDPAVYWLLAEAADRLGRDGEARLALAEHYYLLGEPQSALEQLQRILSTPSDNAHIQSRASARAQQLKSELSRRQQ